MQPEDEADAVVEDVVDLALDERIAREIGVLVRLDGAGAEEGAQERLVRRVLGDADALALQRLGRDLHRLAAAPRRKAPRRLEIAIGEVDLGQRLRRHRVRGDDGVGFAAA